MLVSIIMAAYNAERFISEAINSVLDQTHNDWELIIIDDGSSDNTKAITDEFKDDRIKISSQKNLGVSAARNVGLKKMTGNCFCFLDSDDRMPRHSLSSRLALFDQNTNIRFVDGKVNKWNEDMSQVLQTWSPDFNGNPEKDLLGLTGRSFFGPTWMVRRDPNTEYSFDESITHGEDLLFYVGLTMHGGIYTCTEAVVLDYRVRANSAMSNLVALGKGYQQIEQAIINLGFKREELSTFKKRSKTIMLKSFVSKGRILEGIKYYFGL